MPEHAFAILLAASFTFGCAAMHSWREHAAALTAPLTAALVCLSVLVGSADVVEYSGANANSEGVLGTSHKSR